MALPLPRAAGHRERVLDAVVDHLGAVVARLRAPHLNAVVRAVADRVARDHEGARVERMDRGAERAVDDRIDDLALDVLEHDAVAARADDLAVADRDRAPGRQLDQAGIGRQAAAAAVEDDAGEQDVVGAARNDQRRVVGRDDTRRAGHAEQARAGRKHEAAYAIDAGCEDQRQPRAGEAVDRALQRLGLVLAAVEADAEVDGIDPEPGNRHGGRGRRRRDGFGCAERSGRGGGSDEVATVDGHGVPPQGGTTASRSAPETPSRRGTAD